MEVLALLLGVDCFMWQGRSIVNMIGNAVAVAKRDVDFVAELWKATSPAAAVAVVPDCALAGFAPSLSQKRSEDKEYL